MHIPIPNTGKVLGGDDVFVIAEIGKNFINTKEDQPVEVYLENAIKLVDAAVESGVDAVKFQTHEVEDEVLNIEFTSPHFTGSDRYSWVTRNTRGTPLDAFWKPLKEHCDKKNILFFSTPMSRKAAELLNKLNVPLWKVGSGDVQDYVLLDYLLETKKPIIISSGMVSLEELDVVIRHITERGGELVVMYCVSQYPCPHEQFNLATIEYLREQYPNVVIGFSDHSIDGHDVDLAAIKLGARVIEKHFSHDRAFWGSDHKASILPSEMKNMVNDIRNKKYEAADPSLFYGDKNKELEGAKNQFRPYFNKALVAGRDVPEGSVLTKDLIYAMRPVMHAGGLPSEHFYEVLGRRTAKALKQFDPITFEVLL